MANTTKSEKSDKTTVDINDRSDIENLHNEWKQFSHAQIKEAIQEYGPDKKNIEEYLRKKTGSM